MALVLTHPDYVNPGSGRCEREEYPLKFYSELLKYVQQNYGGEYYHVLPRDLVKFYNENHGDG
jgi:hypothetical protein